MRNSLHLMGGGGGGCKNEEREVRVCFQEQRQTKGK